MEFKFDNFNRFNYSIRKNASLKGIWQYYKSLAKVFLTIGIYFLEN